MPVIKTLPNDVFYALSGLNPEKAYGPDGVPPIVLKNSASGLTPCLVKLLRLCLSSTFSSCWKYAYVQPMPFLFFFFFFFYTKGREWVIGQNPVEHRC